MSDDEKVGETQLLPEWLQDRQVFKMIRRMAFFRLFRIVRAFKQWRLNTRILKHENALKRLTGSFPGEELFRLGEHRVRGPRTRVGMHVV